MVATRDRAPVVAIDADVLGRQRTGDETYVANLLRELAPLAAAAEVRLVAVTRRPDLVPNGIEALCVPAQSQELRMAWSLPRALRRLRPELAHFQHAVPLGYSGPAVVTVHDLSFEREPELVPLRDRLVFRFAVRRAARRADRLLAVSERTRCDLLEVYGVPPDRVVVTPNGADPAFSPGGQPDSYALFVGTIHRRKDPLAAAAAAREAGLRLVVAGPRKDERLARALEQAGAEVCGYVDQARLADLYRRAACVVFPSRFEGFGLPVLEAMASGAPVVAAPDAAVREVAGDAVIFAGPGELGAGVRRAIAERDRLVAAGLERARAFTWAETARRTWAVYQEVLDQRLEAVVET